ncbi:MAG: dihydrolipoamide succinyltransferase, partial [Chromatiaceae bacterium]|nr:dihydrolipoamide succinyltransferase [Chromatiaceae bacterium]
MSSEVHVPPLPESVADATVLAWHKQPGEAVKKDESLVDLETDKVVLEVPATADGVLGAIAAPVGTVVTADTLLALIEPASAGTAAGTVPSPRPEPESDAAGSGHRAEGGARTGAGPVVAPAARRLVKELNLDPAQIPGSGRDGLVQKADVVAYLDERERSAPDRDPEAVPDCAAATESALGA